MLGGLEVNLTIPSSTKLCPEISTYASPTSTSKMVELLGSNYSTTSSGTGAKNRSSRGRRAKKGQETSWVYLNAFEDFSNIRTRDRLMNVYNSSSSDEEPVPKTVPPGITNVNTPAQHGNDLSTSATHFHPNLHALHKFRRERKKGLVSDKNVVISYRPRTRSSLLNRRNFYYRVSDKELEALQSFSFLDDITISSSPDENECSLFNEYLFSMDYEDEPQEQEDDVEVEEQKQVIPLSVKEEQVERDDEHMPNINNTSSLIELIPDIVVEEEQRSDPVSPQCDDAKELFETTDVLDLCEPNSLAEHLPEIERKNSIHEENSRDHCNDDEANDIKFQVMECTELKEFSCDRVAEDDGFHDKQVHAPPSPSSSVVLDRLSLSDSCAESYFGSDSGGSSFFGGK